MVRDARYSIFGQHYTIYFHVLPLDLLVVINLFNSYFVRVIPLCNKFSHCINLTSSYLSIKSQLKNNYFGTILFPQTIHVYTYHILCSCMFYMQVNLGLSSIVRLVPSIIHIASEIKINN